MTGKRAGHARPGRRTPRKPLDGYRASFEQISVGIAHTTLSGKFLQANALLRALLGYSAAELRRLTTRDLTHADDRDLHDAMRIDLLNGKLDSFTAEKRYVRKDGVQIWVKRAVTLARRSPGGPRYLIQVIEDITERKRTEAQLARVMRARRVTAECDHVLVHASDEIAMLDSMCRILVESGGYKMAWAAFATGEPQWPIRAVAHAGYGDDRPMTGNVWSADGRYEGFMLEVIAAGRPHLSRDILNDPQHARRRARAVQHGFQSVITLPLQIDGTFFAALSIYAREADAFDDDEIALLAELAGDIGYGIANLRVRAARQQAEAAASESERRFKETFEQAAAGIARTTLDGRYLQVNRKFADMLGCTLDEMFSMSPRDFMMPEERDRIDTERGRLLRGEVDSVTAERRFMRKDKRVIWANWTLSIARDAEGKPLYFIAVAEDITERKELERRFELTFDYAAIGMVLVGLDGRYQIANRKFAAMLGYTPEELKGMPQRNASYPEDSAETALQRQRLLNGELDSVTGERRFVRKDGSVFWARRTLSLARGAGDEPLYYIGVSEDISEQRKHRERYQVMFENAAVGITSIGIDGVLVDVNQKFCQMLGYERAELIGLPVRDVTHPDDVGEGAGYRDRFTRGEMKSAVGEKRFICKDGSIIWARRTMSVVHDDTGKPQFLVSVVEDISERKRAEDQLKHLAHYDVLTNLPNRLLFYDRLKQALADARRYSWIIGVMFIDIDRFKTINDTLGHAVGDSLLQQAAIRLGSTVRTSDTVGRLGGDEFAVVLSDIGSANDAAVVAQKIMAQFNEPFRVDKGEIFVTASIGITLYPDDGIELDALLKNADVAMYRAKDDGRNTFSFYQPAMDARAAERFDMEVMLRRAVERGEFVLHYQPKIALIGGAIVGAEALIRWNSGELGLVSPLQFIPLAEETGLIVPIGEWALRTACLQNKAWQVAGLPPLAVSVNLSPRQFQQKNLLAAVTNALRDAALDARFLELEITESVLMQHAERTNAVLQSLHDLGVLLSIDDFGTGYSSLAYLKRFPVQRLKIDQSFVRDIASDENDAAIVAAVIAMARSLGLGVVAEGVETREQFDFLAGLKCDECQGFYFSRPVAADEFMRLLRDSHAR